MTEPIREATATASELPRARRDLEARANAARARFVRGLDALIDRKRRLVNPAEELRRHPTEAVILAGTAAVLLVAGLGFVASRISSRDERARRAKWDAWTRLLVHPERVSRRPRDFFLGVIEKGAAATVAALAKHLIEGLLKEPLPFQLASRLPADRDPFPSPAAPR